jgi:hypothetical protein
MALSGFSALEVWGLVQPEFFDRSPQTHRPASMFHTGLEYPPSGRRGNQERFCRSSAVASVVLSFEAIKANLLFDVRQRSRLHCLGVSLCNNPIHVCLHCVLTYEASIELIKLIGEFSPAITALITFKRKLFVRAISIMDQAIITHSSAYRRRECWSRWCLSQKCPKRACKWGNKMQTLQGMQWQKP